MSVSFRYVSTPEGVKTEPCNQSELIAALSPCPFCGEVPTLEMDERLAWILCPEGTICRGSGIIQAFSVENIEQGVTVWNTRKGA